MGLTTASPQNYSSCCYLGISVLLEKDEAKYVALFMLSSRAAIAIQRQSLRSYLASSRARFSNRHRATKLLQRTIRPKPTATP